MSDRVAATMKDVVSRLEETNFATALCVDRRSSDRICQSWERLAEQIRQTGRRPVLVEGNRGDGGRGSVYDSLARWVEQQDRDHQGADQVMRRFDYLTMAMDMGTEGADACEQGERIVDAVVRLVESLVAEQPAVLVVLGTGGLSRAERDAVEALMHHFLVDPLAEVDPASAHEPALGLVWDGSWSGTSRLSSESIAVGETQGVGQIRRFLNEERVVEQVMETTQGDRKRMQALFEALPETVSYLWERRIAELTPAQQRLVEYLAVADEALEVSFLDQLVESAAMSVLRTLYDQGIAVRRMGKAELNSVEIRTAVTEKMDEMTRRQRHCALAEMAIASGRDDGAFVARHALAGGAEGLGARYGIPAARRMLRRGQWEDADHILSTLRNLEELEEAKRGEILELSLRLAEVRGQWRQALTMAKRRREVADDAVACAKLDRRMAGYLAKLGEHKSAGKRFEAALDHLDVEQAPVETVRVWLGMAEIAYQRGDHEDAQHWAERARTALNEQVEEGPETMELLVESRRILGRTLLYCGDLEEARRRFEENATEARRLGHGGFESCAEVNLGVVAVQQRRYDEAERRLRRALGQSDACHEGAPRLNCWLNLGIVYQRRGQFTRALDHYRRSLREALRQGDDVAYEVAAHNLATLYLDIGAFDAARQLVDHLRERSGTDAAVDPEKEGGFARRWRAMIEAQIALKKGQARRALEALERAQRPLTDKRRLYGTEMQLRRVIAHLELDEVQAARSVLESVDEQERADLQLAALYRYYEAAVARREGAGPEERSWRSIIDGLESLGLYRDAVGARLELAAKLRDDDGREEAARLLIEQGVAELRRRAERVPERFQPAFYSAPSHRRLLREYRRLSGEVVAGESEPASHQVSDDAMPSPPSSEVPQGVDRDDPAYRQWRARYAELVGEDPQMLQVFRFVDRVAPSETTVLLVGESGTGKELVAQALHDQSKRRGEPFIKVNCAAFVEELLLSELFGHEKGAFTGAVKDRVGRFERADGGTIFLDEIGDISPKTQVALLRVLQEGSFETVGGTETHSVDTRVVAATNRDLDAMVREGSFRLDLYYRLKGFVIEMPPLRERRQDIPRLLHHFSQQFSSGEDAPRFSDEAIQFLARYQWPGNVRELKNFVRSVLLFAEKGSIEMDHVTQLREFFSREDMGKDLPPIDPQVDWSSGWDEEKWSAPPAKDTEEALVEQVVADRQSLRGLKKRLELKCIKKALRQTEGNISQAARILQMKRPRLSQIVNGTDELLELKKELVG